MKRDTLFIILGIGLGLCLLTAVFSALAFRQYFQMKNQKQPAVSEVIRPGTGQHYPKPEKPLVVEDSAMACIRDIRGGEAQLYDYRSVCLEDRDVLDYQGAWLSDDLKPPVLSP